MARKTWSGRGHPVGFQQEGCPGGQVLRGGVCAGTGWTRSTRPQDVKDMPFPWSEGTGPRRPLSPNTIQSGFQVQPQPGPT